MQYYTVRILGVSRGEFKYRSALIYEGDAKRAEEKAIRRFKKDYPKYLIESVETVS